MPEPRPSTSSTIETMLARYRNVPTFADLHVDILRSLARSTELVSLVQGAVLFNDGDPADALYIVDEGAIEIVKGDPPTRLALLTAGQIFGEMGLMDLRARTATARAASDVRLLRLEGRRINTLLRRSPALLYRLVSHLANLLRDTDQKMIRDLQTQNKALEAAYRDLQSAQKALIDKARLDREVALAQELQRAILPTEFPDVPGFTIAARSRPALEVGGDFYDLIALDDQRVGIVMADVSDKGVYAGMFMTMCHALIHAEAQRHASPADALRAVHHLIRGLPMTRMFVTVIYAVIDRTTNILTYARAGHEAPLLVHADGSLVELDAPGVLISAALPLLLADATIQLVPGDVLIFYTDGVTEATAPSRLRFGSDRLLDFARAHAQSSPAAIADDVLTAVATWTATAPQHDDTAVLVVRVEHTSI